MDIKVFPCKWQGEVEAVASKSYAQRMILAAALCEKPTTIYINHISKDIRHSITLAGKLGAEIIEEGHNVTVQPNVGNIGSEPREFNFGESGTLARIALPVLTCLCTSGGRVSGEGSLLLRPFAPICNALSDNGLEIKGETLPIKFSGSLKSGEFRITGGESSQYISGLMYALPLLDGKSKISLTTPLQSSGYVNMTVEVLQSFGVKTGYQVEGNQKFTSPGSLKVEGDWSNASYFIGNGIKVNNLNQKSLQKDRQFEEVKDLEEIDLAEIPDLAPALAIYCANKKNGVRTRFLNIDRLRIKESNRVKSIEQMIKNLGGTIAVSDNEIIINGGGIKGGIVDSYNDHRIVMAAVMAGHFATSEIIITGAEAVNKSYPKFFEDVRSVGGEINVL